MNQRQSQNMSHVSIYVSLMIRNVTGDEKWNSDKCQCECKKPVKHCIIEEDYTWNPNA